MPSLFPKDIPFKTCGNIAVTVGTITYYHTVVDNLIKSEQSSLCTEVASEMYETNDFLAQMGIPPLTYKRDKTFPVSDYGDQAPDIETCKFECLVYI